MQKFKRKNGLSFLVGLILAMVITGCGADPKEDKSSSESNVTSDSPTDTTTDSAVEPTAQPTEEPADEYYGLSKDEYYVDCPIVLDDGRLVFVKKVPNLQYYPEGKENADGETCLEEYEKSNKTFTTSLSIDENNIIAQTQVAFDIDNNDHEFINMIKDPYGFLNYYEVGNPEIWKIRNTEITFYQLSIPGWETKNYILYYPLDDKYSMGINIWGFIDDELGNFEDELEKVFEFYRTEQDVFVVIGSTPEIEDDEIVSGDVIEDNTEDGSAVENKYDLSASYTVIYEGQLDVYGKTENLILADNPDWADKKITFTTDGVTGTLSMTAPTVIGNGAAMGYTASGTERIMLFGEPSFYMFYVRVATGTEEEFAAYYNDMQNLTREDLIKNVGNLGVENGIYEVEKGEDYVRTYTQFVPLTKIPHPSLSLTLVSAKTNYEYEITITDLSINDDILPEETRAEMMSILRSVEEVVE